MIVFQTRFITDHLVIVNREVKVGARGVLVAVQEKANAMSHSAALPFRQILVTYLIKHTQRSVRVEYGHDDLYVSFQDTGVCVFELLWNWNVIWVETNCAGYISSSIQLLATLVYHLHLVPFYLIMLITGRHLVCHCCI